MIKTRKALRAARVAGLLAGTSLFLPTFWHPARAATGTVEIRRTTDGIPHIRADDWRDLGFGVGYAQAQDALCTLAEAFVTYEGRRAFFFGAQARPSAESTFGLPTNLELDFFFRAFADQEALARYRTEQPPELNALVEGFAAGYNRQLAEARGAAGASRRPCANAPWAREISAADVYRRLYAAQIAAGYARFVTEIVNAQPPAAGPHDKAEASSLPSALPSAPSTPSPSTSSSSTHPSTRLSASSSRRSTLADRLAHRLGLHEGLGSNMMAFGHKAAGAGQAVLFGNPHWYWGGPDRFYQMHLSLPGRLDAAGVAFLGVPVIMIGFNADVAWSHTVSEARRFGLFELKLDPQDPTRHIVDGRSEPMDRRQLTVAYKAEDGSVRHETRTLYRTRFGPVIDLGANDPALAWRRGHALAVRDVNADNFRVFRNFFQWNRARSLDEFIAIHRREAATPWVNTTAIGRGDGRVWYGDIGAVPNVPDALRASCTTPAAERLAELDALMPVLDGSRSACDWVSDPSAAQPGAMPAAAMPHMLREDYVANMNDSYWLTNPAQPLEGYPLTLGGERMALSLRGRLGHRMAQALMAGADGKGPQTSTLSERLMRDVLTPRTFAAEVFKDELLPYACASSRVALSPPKDEEETARAGAKAAAPRQIDVRAACEVLRRWPNRSEVGDRGALLWDEFWSRLRELPEAALYRVPFSAQAPLATPSGVQGPDPRIAQALAAAVAAMAEKGLRVDAASGSWRHIRTGGAKVPVYGGCAALGYFTIMCPGDEGAMDATVISNTYMQVVRFRSQGVEAHTMLAHGQDERAMHDGPGSAPILRYARKDWLRFPFKESEIAGDVALTRTILKPSWP